MPRQQLWETFPKSEGKMSSSQLPPTGQTFGIPGEIRLHGLFLISTLKSAFAETLTERPPGSRAGSVSARRRTFAQAVRYHSIILFIAEVVQPCG